MNSLIDAAKIVPLILMLAGCGGGTRLVKEKCGALVANSASAVETRLAGKAMETYSGHGPASTAGYYLTGSTMQYAVRDDGSALVGSVINYEFEGELKGGKPHGLGIATYSCKKSDCVYAGTWRNGTKHGHGVMRIGNSCYVGEWQYDKPHGQGTRYDVHTYHGLGTTVGTFKDGTTWNTEDYNDDVLVGRVRNGNFAMAEEYFARKRDRQQMIEQRTTAIMDAVMRSME